MSGVRAACVVFRREFAVAAREAAVSVAPFVAALVVLAGLAFGPAQPTLQATAPGLLWIVVLVAAIPLSHGVAAAEHRDDTWDQLRCLAPPSAFLAGKVAFVWMGLLVTWVFAAIIVAVVFGGITPASHVLLGAVLGTLAFATITTVFAVLTGAGTRRAGLLAVLLLPAGLPALLAGTQTATAGVPPVPWLVLLGGYDALVLTAAWAVFPALLEE